MADNLHTSLGLKLRFRSWNPMSVKIVYQSSRQSLNCPSLPDCHWRGRGLWLRQDSIVMAQAVRCPRAQHSKQRLSPLAPRLSNQNAHLCNRFYFVLKALHMQILFVFVRVLSSAVKKKALSCTFNGCNWCNVYFLGVFLHFTNILFFFAGEVYVLCIPS